MRDGYRLSRVSKRKGEKEVTVLSSSANQARLFLTSLPGVCVASLPLQFSTTKTTTTQQRSHREAAVASITFPIENPSSVCAYALIRARATGLALKARHNDLSMTFDTE